MWTSLLTTVKTLTDSLDTKQQSDINHHLLYNMQCLLQIQKDYQSEIDTKIIKPLFMMNHDNKTKKELYFNKIM